jgi:hypothetical protein
MNRLDPRYQDRNWNTQITAIAKYPNSTSIKSRPQGARSNVTLPFSFLLSFVPEVRWEFLIRIRFLPLVLALALALAFILHSADL